MKHVFIINVNSNSGKTTQRVEEIRKICKALEVDYEIYVTDSRETTMDIAKKFRDEFCVVYAVGGDGTINAVLNSLMGGEAYLGVVPFGSGNDIYRTLKEYGDLVTECNVMKVNDMYCLNIFSAGLDAEICEAAEKMKKLSIPRSQIYNLGMAYTFFKYKNQPMLVKADSEVYYGPNMTMVTVCNGKYYGNGYQIAPAADMRKAGADVYMLGDLNRWELPGFLKSVIRGTHEENDGLVKTSAKKIEITSEHPVVANVDGEILKADQFNINAEAGKIKVVQNRRVLKLIRKK